METTIVGTIAGIEEIIAEKKKMISEIEERIKELENEHGSTVTVDMNVYLRVRNVTRGLSLNLNFNLRLEENNDFSYFNAWITDQSWGIKTDAFMCEPVTSPTALPIRFVSDDDAKSFLKNLVCMLLPADEADRIECYMVAYNSNAIHETLATVPNWEVSGDCIPGLMLDVAGMLFHAAHRRYFGN